MENWKELPGYRGKYKISDLGRVLSFQPRGRGPVPRFVGYTEETGYQSVYVRNDGQTAKRRRIHQLVLEAFARPAKPNEECGHLNGKRSDNRLCNLRWVTKKENAHHSLIHGTRVQGEGINTCKLTGNSVKEIRRLYKDGFSRGDVNRLAKQYGVSRQTIRHVAKGLTWKHLHGA